MSPEIAGALSWGVKDSFREYVSGVSDGTVSVDGAGQDGTSRFIFPLVDATEFDTGTGLGQLRFSGSVEFSAYRGVLLVRVRDPWISMHESGGVLSIMHPAYREPTTERSEIATFDSPARSTLERANWTVASTRLTYDGCRALGEIYPVGTEADPFDFRITRTPAHHRVG